jgi:hypothetical protein
MSNVYEPYLQSQLFLFRNPTPTRRFFFYGSDFNFEKLRNFLAMSSKDKTSRAEKSWLNALKCTFFTLKIQIFLERKSKFMGVIIFKLAFFSQREYLFECVKKLHFHSWNAFSFTDFTCLRCSLPKQPRTDDEDSCSTLNDNNVSFFD